jgi:hypothetical protein
MNVSPELLIDGVAQKVERRFAKDAVYSYIEMEQRFLAGDWQPTELDGGRLCEAVSWALYQLDTGKVDDTKSPYEVRSLLLDRGRAHKMDEPDRTHIVKVIEAVYKLRSDRGAVHISAKHDANSMDSMLVLHCCKWILAEFLRLTWHQDKQVIGEVISQLVQLEHTLVHELDGKPLVMDASLGTKEELLILLYHAPRHRLSRQELKAFAPHRTTGSISTAISRMVNARELRIADNGEIALTPKGQALLISTILPKLRPSRSAA